ncbi:MAG: hypothetical protein AAF638_10800 [Pseudomonadota bacterium]
MANQRRSVLQRFIKDDGGMASLEFAVALPFVVIIMCMAAEIGILTGRTVLLKRGVDIAIRDVRLGAYNTVGDAAFRRTICANAFLIDTCERDLTIDMTPIQAAALDGSLRQTVVCRNREDEDATPVTDFDPGLEGSIMLVRVCLVVDPVFPGTALGAGLNWQRGAGTDVEPTGGYWITAITAFMNESDSIPTS